MLRIRHMQARSNRRALFSEKMNISYINTSFDYDPLRFFLNVSRLNNFKHVSTGPPTYKNTQNFP